MAQHGDSHCFWISQAVSLSHPLQIPHGLALCRVTACPDSIVIEVKPRAGSALCPDCGNPSHQVHSHYRRSLSDLPWQGRPTILVVSARRFRCSHRACARRTFAELLEGAATRRGRHTSRLIDLQRYIAVALGGSAGARMAERICCPVSADTLGRRILSLDVNSSEHRPLRVLGVDDWAWRRRRRYGTILVDPEQNKVVDLLPDRRSETLACWLRANPWVEIVARDRAGAYADGIRQGAPSALHVSDRWHILRNFSDAFIALIDRHSAAAKRIAAELYTRPQPVDILRHGTVDRESSLAAASQWVKSMDLLLRKKTKASIDGLLDIGVRTPLTKFAPSLRRDLSAIKNALATPWTTSPAEGQISKLKIIRRTMYGRAGFQLLRARILHAH